ncbi:MULTISPECIES: glucose PTS transporter subunit IIA [Cutibacterium]|jgi:PTS system beta-glucosides-specific IIC component|uniref:glucose PTS transporter subunit IIA n=1 Tax=Cutibacterium TaxID=1912216 RepID=UPI0001C4D29D|nr:MULTISPECIES: glucose PTS transporter subunit IIA [Cutibacterium]EGL44036.1 phosphotransferase system, EIIB [Propionibacterium sp. 409-HC1]EGR90468.1 PTS family porter, EIIC [Propionibacterium sp. CC003-HC2]OFL28467.1 PTS beta-glucoside transporter subunit EIIBCA [Propionibacterium sp. HMSC078F01]OFO85546.1 PTS beta-glucoside transporter subunit EIIBCA [Propionibacterium sp. HMSC062D05]OFP23307.1 PTS beta-glucoside transporter subunit EIIBCA [Propionibacterium sp. HMSC062D02]OFS43188.1 PTS
MSSPASQIVDAVGGPDNIVGLTHCATRLRFQLRDSSPIDKAEVEAIPSVMGAVPQSGNRYQIVIGGAVAGVYNDIMDLPAMKGLSSSSGNQSDADVKAEHRSKGPRGKFSWLDNLFEYLSDSFRPIMGALLGASLFITFMALMGSLGVIGNWADSRVTLPPSWQFVNLAWQCVFYFLPLLVAYNATKRLNADPWVGFSVMAVVMLPAFTELGKTAHPLTLGGFKVNVVDVFGLPLTIFNYGSQVFPPLIMAAILAPLYKWLKKIISPNVQMIFVPFLTMLIMIPLTAFLIGPIGVYAGAGLANGLKAVNDVSPFIFAVLIPLLYPFMVPLGLHWPLNAVMLLNIQTLGYDYIQGPMGAWNFACFGATAGVLFLSVRDKDVTMRQTAIGALAAGLLGGISEPSLYGIHLRYKKIYPSMLVGCLVGGVIIGAGGGLHTPAFVFTSLLTIPAFDKIGLYSVAIAASFFTAMALVIVRDYRDNDEKAAAKARRRQASAHEAEPTAAAPAAATESITETATVEGAEAPTAAEVAAEAVTVTSPLEGRAVPISEIPDPVFSTGVVGDGIAIEPTSNTVVCPADATVVTAPDSGHAFGLKLDSGVELLIHVGIDTVELGGKGFDVKVKAGDHVSAGQPLVVFDPTVIDEAGYSKITPVLVTNGFDYSNVTGIPADDVTTGTPVITVVK